MTGGRVDVNVPRFNQGVVAVVTALGFIVQIPWLVGAMFVVLALSAIGGPRVAPLSRFYVGVLRPRFLADRPIVTEPAAPPRFAQVLGTAVLGAAVAAFLGGWTTVGWVLTLIVTTLAGVAALAKICVGCLIYERAFDAR